MSALKVLEFENSWFMLDSRLVSHSEMGPNAAVAPPGLAIHDATAALMLESSNELAAPGVDAVPAGVGAADDGTDGGVGVAASAWAGAGAAVGAEGSAHVG